MSSFSRLCPEISSSSSASLVVSRLVPRNHDYVELAIAEIARPAHLKAVEEIPEDMGAFEGGWRHTLGRVCDSYRRASQSANWFLTDQRRSKADGTDQSQHHQLNFLPGSTAAGWARLASSPAW